MAISIISASPLIGSPIVFRVVPAAYSANRTFHRIIVRVYAGLETDADYTIFEFSKLVETKPSVQSYATKPELFDISSALRAVADKYEYGVTPTTRYPYIKFRVESSEEWMVDGIVYDRRNVSYYPGTAVSAHGENLLPGADTGVGWTDEQGNAATYVSGSGFYVTDSLVSPAVNLTDGVNYVLSFDTDDQCDVYLYDVTADTYTQLNITGEGTNVRAAFIGIGGPVKIVIRASQEGNYWNLSLHTGEEGFLYFYAFMGSFTDLERMKASVDQSGVEYLNITYLSRKPASTEIVFKDKPYLYPGAFNRGLESDYVDSETGDFVSGAPTDGPKSLSYTPTTLGVDAIGGHNLYVVDADANSYQLRFVNGMGCMESLCVQSLVKREVPITTDKHTVAKQETLKKFSRSIVKKSNDRETWYLTSGALDRDWASWYVHEFLMSEQVWIGLNSQLSIINSQLIWIPCHVVPEETTLLEDLTKAQPYEVQFKLEMDINGSPL